MKKQREKRLSIDRYQPRLVMAVERLERRTAMAVISSGSTLVVSECSIAASDAFVRLGGENTARPPGGDSFSIAAQSLGNDSIRGVNRPVLDKGMAGNIAQCRTQSSAAAFMNASDVGEAPNRLTKTKVSASTTVASQRMALWTSGQYAGWTSSRDSFDPFLQDTPRVPRGITFRIDSDRRTIKDLSIQFYASWQWSSGYYATIQARLVDLSESGMPQLTLARTRAWQTFTFEYVDGGGYTWNTELKLRWNAGAKRFSAVVNADTNLVTDSSGTSIRYTASDVRGQNIRRARM